MNKHVQAEMRSRRHPLSTQAAEGMPRQRWCLDDVLAMQQAGVLRYV